jgi:hypothetical protein
MTATTIEAEHLKIREPAALAAGFFLAKSTGKLHQV